MKPYYEHDGIQIFHGDCREILPLLPPESVNAVLTSPPYNVGLKYASYDDSKTAAEFEQFCRDWFAPLWNLCAEGSRAYLVVSDSLAFWIRNNIADWTWGQLLTWCKPNFAGGTTAIKGDWNYMTEQIVLLRKGKRTPMLNGEGNTHSYFVVAVPQSQFTEGRFHPAQFPIKLPMRILSRTPGDVILDPFCGSGTTLMAAKKLGRTAIGIEIEEKYCEIAAKRLSQEVFQF